MFAFDFNKLLLNMAIIHKRVVKCNKFTLKCYNMCYISFDCVVEILNTLVKLETHSRVLVSLMKFYTEPLMATALNSSVGTNMLSTTTNKQTNNNNNNFLCFCNGCRKQHQISVIGS